MIISPNFDNIWDFIVILYDYISLSFDVKNKND